MKRTAALLFLAWMIVPAAAAAPRERAEEAPAVTELRRELDTAVASKLIPGATVLIARDGALLANVTTGWADIERRIPLRRDAIFRLYSMSKPITSVAILMLAEQGKLRLDDPVAHYLPEFANMRVYASGEGDALVTEAAKRPMTIADLLTHRSGLTYHFSGTTPVHQYYRKHGVMRDTPVGRLPGDGAPARSLDELVTRLAKAPLLHQPGEIFAYSYSTTVLGAVIERASGVPLDRFLEHHIFGPLEMKDTSFLVTDAQLPRFTQLYGPAMALVEQAASSDYRKSERLLDGGGALAGTADDYLRFAQMLANGGVLRGKRLLREKSVDLLFLPRTPLAAMGPQKMQFSYGFAIGDADSDKAHIQPAGTASWSGSGNTYFFVDRRRKAAAVLMTHVLGTSGTVRASVNGAARALIGA